MKKKQTRWAVLVTAFSFCGRRIAFCALFLSGTLLLLACWRGSFFFTSDVFAKQPPPVEGRHLPPVPQGYILPARLEQPLSVRRARAGDAIQARITQEVPLPNREKIAVRTIIKGTILNVARDEDEKGVQLTLRFDELTRRRALLPVATSLRAIASSFAVHEAQQPNSDYDESTRLSWANTIQIGGDYRYGDGGRVRNRHRETVGQAVPGGVLVNVKANPQMGCEGSVAADEPPQALWLFSADACGVYGLKGVELLRNGSNAPVGEITLHFKKTNMVLRAGTGLLLRVVSRP